MTTTRYSIIWSVEDEDRITYIDHGDGSYVSEGAWGQAASKLLEFAAAKHPAGLYVNGRFEAGTDVLAEVEAEHRACRGVHRITYSRGPQAAVDPCGQHAGWHLMFGAYCTCGWSCRDSTDSVRRCAVRSHRQQVKEIQQ